MRKARSSKEKPADLEVAPEEPTESAPRRKSGRRRRDPEAGDANGVGDRRARGRPRLRPVLTAISRPVRDDDLNAGPRGPLRARRSWPSGRPSRPPSQDPRW